MQRLGLRSISRPRPSGTHAGRVRPCTLALHFPKSTFPTSFGVSCSHPLAPSPRGSFHQNFPRIFSSKTSRFTYDEPVGASLIPVINQLQEVCSLVGDTLIDLPQIVVIGGQSSGKSSVLENLVGRDFLPRGSGLVTRRPLILQLHRIEGTREWGEFLHKPGQKMDFDEIRDEIEAETARLAGGNKQITSEPIILKIYSPFVLPLTLVDTPGMTRVPVGDQPHDIEAKIRKMILEYISQPNAIILAVQAANTDLATSDALKLAREVDIRGERTVGVLTKLDIMDKGTDAMDILSGRTFPMKLGIVPIVNRSQQDISKQKSITDALQDEDSFFKSHPTYRALAEKSGTHYLAYKCNKLLGTHIKVALPGLRNEIRKKLKEKQEELQAFGTAAAPDKPSQGWLLLHLLNKFGDNFKAAIEGIPTDTPTNELNGGARIRYIFHDTFMKHMDKIDPLEGLDVRDIRTAIRNAAGARPALFVPENAFELLVKKQIELLKEPSIRCAEMVYDELLRITVQLEPRELARFPNLKSKVIDIASTVLRKSLKPTTKMIEEFIQCELAYINTNHPDFMGSKLLSKAGLLAESDTLQHEEVVMPSAPPAPKGGFLSSFFGGKKEATGTQSSTEKSKFMNEPPLRIQLEESLSERDKTQIHLLRNLIRSYFKIAQRNVQENVTKAIMRYLVLAAKENLQKELTAELYHEEMLEILLQEDNGVAAKRKHCADQIDALKKAKKIVQAAELNNFSMPQ